MQSDNISENHSNSAGGAQLPDSAITLIAWLFFAGAYSYFVWKFYCIAREKRDARAIRASIGLALLILLLPLFFFLSAANTIPQSASVPNPVLFFVNRSLSALGWTTVYGRFVLNVLVAWWLFRIWLRDPRGRLPLADGWPGRRSGSPAARQFRHADRSAVLCGLPPPAALSVSLFLAFSMSAALAFGCTVMGLSHLAGGVVSGKALLLIGKNEETPEEDSAD